MVREPHATMQSAPQDHQVMSEHRIPRLKPHLRLEWRGQDGHNETEQPDHSASLGDSITSSTRIRFSVHTSPCRTAAHGADGVRRTPRYDPGTPCGSSRSTVLRMHFAKLNAETSGGLECRSIERGG